VLGGVQPQQVVEGVPVAVPLDQVRRHEGVEPALGLVDAGVQQRSGHLRGDVGPGHQAQQREQAPQVGGQRGVRLVEGRAHRGGARPVAGDREPGEPVPVT
jgi:hypothetical protein